MTDWIIVEGYDLYLAEEFKEDLYQTVEYHTVKVPSHLSSERDVIIYLEANNLI